MFLLLVSAASSFVFRSGNKTEYTQRGMINRWSTFVLEFEVDPRQNLEHRAQTQAMLEQNPDVPTSTGLNVSARQALIRESVSQIPRITSRLLAYVIFKHGSRNGCSLHWKNSTCNINIACVALPLLFKESLEIRVYLSLCLYRIVLHMQ